MNPPDQRSWDAANHPTQPMDTQAIDHDPAEEKPVSDEVDISSLGDADEGEGVSSPAPSLAGNDARQHDAAAPIDQPFKWRGAAYSASPEVEAPQAKPITQQFNWRGATYSPSALNDQDYLKSLETIAEAGVVPPNASPRKGWSISLKATALAVVIGVVPVLGVGTLAYRTANNSITDRIAEQELEETNQLAGQLRQYLQERLANVKTVAGLVNALPVYAPDLGDEEKASLRQELTNELTQFVRDYRTYASLSVFDLQGNVLVQSSGSAAEPNQFEADYFQRVLQTGTPVISEPMPIASQGGVQRFSVYVAAPVISQTGDTEAVVAAQIPVDFIGNAVLRNAISSDEERDASEFYRLVASDGTIFQSLPTQADDSEIGTSITTQIPDYDSVHEQRQLIGWIGRTADWEALNVYAPVAGLGDLNWSVMTSSSTTDVFVPQRQLLRTLVFGSTLTALAAVLLGAFLAKRATRPIERVAEAVERLGQGQLGTRVRVEGNDELALLGVNVNRMAGQLQILLRTLRRNAEQLGRQNDVLAGLARDESLIQGNAQGAAQVFTEAIARTLDLERVSVWAYEQAVGSLNCLAEYQLSTAQHQSGQLLITSQLPNYFKVVTQNPVLAIENIHQDEIAQELVTHHLLAEDTVSVLEIPIQISGTFAGSLRCEHRGQPRQWKLEEQNFVNSIANLMALALESEFLQGEVGHLLEVVSAVEDGDLDTQAQVSERTTGLVADTFNRLIERLTQVLRQAVDTTRQVASSANRQKAQAELIATNADQQVDGANQVLQLTARVQNLAQEAANRVATSRASLQTLQKTVEEGQGVMTSLTTGIDILQEGSDRIIQQMKTLGEFVGLADQFVQDQTQIASLTQTLALNASLVAARAAEQQDPRQFALAAREFSSIANQVSQLAQQTNDSLTRMEQRSAQIQSVVFNVDASVQKVGDLVDDFTQGVDQSSRAFDDVRKVTVEAVNAEAVVAEASQEIIKAVQLTTDLAGFITDIATQTAGLTQDNRQQSEQMETLAHQLLETMVFFQLPSDSEPIEQTPAEDSEKAAKATLTVRSQLISVDSSAAESA